MLKKMYYRPYKIPRYDKNAKQNKCILSFALRKSTDLADLLNFSR